MTQTIRRPAGHVEMYSPTPLQVHLSLEAGIAHNWHYLQAARKRGHVAAALTYKHTLWTLFDIRRGLLS